MVYLDWSFGKAGGSQVEENWIGHEARLIPVAGTSKGNESELRATSALLAVLRVVRPFSRSLLGPLGASKADRAIVDTYIEVPYELDDGRKIRPDGVICVRYGKGEPFVALVEVKTGTSDLVAQQVNDYWDLATQRGYDCVITISNEIAPTEGVHPTTGLKVRSNSKVPIHHWSWPMVLSEALAEKQHRGVSDPEQAWILQELIRYLEHDSSGALEFSDMGKSWTAVVDACRDGTLTPRSPEAPEATLRWDQLLRYVALRLGRETGLDVAEVVSRKHRLDPKLRQRDMLAELCDDERLRGLLRVPDTAGDIDIRVNLKARQIAIGTEIDAPDDKSARARISWLTRQLKEVDLPLNIEAFTRGARQPTICALQQAVEDPGLLRCPDGREPTKFRILYRVDTKLLRRGSKRSGGFAEELRYAVETFYWAVLQNVAPYQRRPTKVEEPVFAPYLNVTPVGGPVNLAPPPGFSPAIPTSARGE